MKKILTFALAVVLLLSLSAACYAANDGAKLSLSAAANPVKQGDSVKLTVNLSDAPKAKSLALIFDYDVNSTFTVVGGRWLLSGAIIADFDLKTSACGRAAIAFADSTNFNGKIFELELKVKNSAASGEKKITVTPIIMNGTETIPCAETSIKLTVGSNSCPQAKFSDKLPEAHWAHESVDYVLNRGIMSGTSATTFEPDGTVSRAMIAVMLYNISGEPSVSAKNPFKDVRNSDWFALPVVWAYENGIVSGYEDGTFNPDGKITREQLAVMMQNYAAYMGKNTSASYDLSRFTDAKSISPWAAESVKWACAVGLMSGSADGNKLYMDPQGSATRAQIAVIFQNYCETFGI